MSHFLSSFAVCAIQTTSGLTVGGLTTPGARLRRIVFRVKWGRTCIRRLLSPLPESALWETSAEPGYRHVRAAGITRVVLIYCQTEVYACLFG